MDDAPQEVASENDGVDSRPNEEGHSNSDGLEVAPATTLVEVTPGVAVVFGEVPRGLELIGLDILSPSERTQLTTALGSLGNIGTVVGNVAEYVSSAQGLFRVNDATFSLLKSGGQWRERTARSSERSSKMAQWSPRRASSRCL